MQLSERARELIDQQLQVHLNEHDVRAPETIRATILGENKQVEGIVFVNITPNGDTKADGYTVTLDAYSLEELEKNQ